MCPAMSGIQREAEIKIRGCYAAVQCQTVNVTVVGWMDHRENYLFPFLCFGDKARSLVVPLNTQCLENGAKSRNERNVLNS